MKSIHQPISTKKTQWRVSKKKKLKSKSFSKKVHNSDTTPSKLRQRSAENLKRPSKLENPWLEKSKQKQKSLSAKRNRPKIRKSAPKTQKPLSSKWKRPSTSHSIKHSHHYSSFDKYRDFLSYRDKNLEPIDEEDTVDVWKNVTTISSSERSIFFWNIPVWFVIMIQWKWRRRKFLKRLKQVILQNRARKGKTPSFADLEVEKGKEQVSILDI